MYQNIQKLRENPETSNAGKKWLEDEIDNLIHEIKKNISFDDIAKIHKRTPSSITGKLLSIAVSYITQKNMDINDVSKIVNLSVKSIQDHMEKYPDKKIKNIKTPSNQTSESNKELTGEEIVKLFQPSISITLGIPIEKLEETNINVEKKEIKLNYEQESALKAFKSGKNIFLTGPAGTGKSVTLGKIKEYCIQNNKQKGITATTGTAAFLLGGKTLHSYLGIGLAKESAEELYLNIRKFKHITDRLRSCDVLIIDEISMLDADLLDKISEYLQIMRRSNKPFGGIQVVLTGDFCQLEPVSGDYCFKSKVWPLLELKLIYLHKLIRQDGDLQFQNILSKVRYGKCPQKMFELLSSMSSKDFGEIKPTILYPRNYDVDKVNKVESDKLIASGAKKETYKVIYSKCKNVESAKNYIKSLDIPESIIFCVGDQVVVTVNVDQDEGIVNGTRGIVIDVDCDWVMIKKTNGKELKIRYFKSTNPDFPDIKIMPLKLAYALSIHKSQGMTLDAIEIDIGSKIFASGQAYTALSRAQNLNSVKVKSISKKSFIIHPDVLEFYQKIEEDIKTTNTKFITKYINIMINNISNHIKLDDTLDFIWEFIPEYEDKILEFFNEYDLPKLSETSDNYLKLKEYLFELKDFMLDNIDIFREKIRESHLFKNLKI
jgi:hypothetical protein